ncbi:MAG: ABC transporter ATP-binding protein [Pseudomonadota bacterium]
MNSMMTLQLDSVTKTFGGLVAVSDVTLSVNQGERCVILGPNGAGKTTLFHCITGTIPISSGTIRIFGKNVSRMPPNARTRLGVGRTFQITNLFAELTLLENVILAVYGRERGARALFTAWRTDRSAVDKAYAELDRVGLDGKADWEVAELSYGERRQLELALALVGKPRLLLLDEPCAGLAQAERQAFAKLIRAIPRDVTSVVVEHDMDVAFAIADRLIVMNQGALICDGEPEVVRKTPEVQEVYLGDA